MNCVCRKGLEARNRSKKQSVVGSHRSLRPYRTGATAGLGGDGDGLAGVGGGSHLECCPISPPSLQPCQRQPRCASFDPPWCIRADLPSSWPREATLWTHRFDSLVHISKQSLYVMLRCWVLWVPWTETRWSCNRINLSALAHEMRNWVLIRPLIFKMAVRVDVLCLTWILDSRHTRHWNSSRVRVPWVS